MSTIIDDIERGQLRPDLPEFAPGDRVRVHFLVIEGNRSRPQVFEGVVIKRQGSGVRETFTVRKQSFGVGVERTFPLHSPKIEKLEVASRGRVRRAKLYYLRGRTGKAARVAERRWGIDDEVLAAGSTGAVDASGEGLAPEEVPEEVTPEEPTTEGGEEASAEAGQDGEGQAPKATEDGQADSEPGDDGADQGGEQTESAAGDEGDESAAEVSDDEPEAAGDGDGESDQEEVREQD